MMSALRRRRVCAVLALVCLLSGCRSASQRVASVVHPAWKTKSTTSARTDEIASASSEDSITPVAHQSIEEAVQEDPSPTEITFDTSDELQLDALIAAVHACNPSMQAAHAAWSAAAERYPQAVAFDDPTLQTMMGPATFSSGSADPSSFYVGAAQKVPWQGKRGLRGQMAQWEANAAGWDTQEVKLRLALATRLSFFDLYLVARELELNQRNVELMQDFRTAAKAKYEANQVSGQDLSAADLELAKLQQQRLELEQMKRTATARINTLLHRRPDTFLPPPPRQLSVSENLAQASELRELAVEHRPELAALNSKIQSEQNAVMLACKEYYPDFEFMGRYDSFWSDRTQRPQVGMNMNVPLNTGRRGAAVREAQFRVSKLMAEYCLLQDSVREEVEIAHSRVFANQKAAELFDAQILPAAQTNLETARAAYIAGSIDFLRLMEARRQYTEQQIAYQKTLTEFHRSLADLERAVGINLDNSPAQTSESTLRN